MMRVTIVALLVLSILFGRWAFAASVEEIALYSKSDRQKILAEGARKEGKLTWYSSLIVRVTIGRLFRK